MSDLAELSPDNLPDILIADAQDVRSLRDIFLETRLLMNCVNPLSLYKDIIEGKIKPGLCSSVSSRSNNLNLIDVSKLIACLMARCDYMDLCSDIYLIESNFLEFHIEAQKKGVCIIHGCGFDSAVAEMGTLLTRNIAGVGCHIIESFLDIKAPQGLGKRHMIDNIISTSKYQHQIKGVQSRIDEKFRVSSIKHPGPRVEKKTPYYFDKRINLFATPSYGADTYLMAHAFRAYILRENHRTLPQYHSYLTTDNYYTATSSAFYGALFSSLAVNSFGRSIVRSFPEVLTDGVLNHKRPTPEQMAATSFKMIFIARGFTKPLPSLGEKGYVSDMDNASSMSDLSDMGELRSPSGRAVINREMLNETSSGSTIPCTFLFLKANTASKVTYKTDLGDKIPFEKWVKVSGPDPYCTTSTIMAARLAQFYLITKYQENVMLSRTMPLGGVFTPSSVFYGFPKIFDHLTDAGVEFAITSELDEEEQQSSNLQEKMQMLPSEHLDVVGDAIISSKTSKGGESNRITVEGNPQTDHDITPPRAEVVETVVR